MPLDRIDGEILFDIDYNSLEQALQGTGWLSGWATTGNAGTLSIDVAAGKGMAAGAYKSTGGSTNVVLSAADPSNPRKDLIVWDTSAGALAKVDGTPGVISPAGETNARKMKVPAPPDLGATDDIIIAEVYVPVGATKGSDCTVIDKRVMLPLVYVSGQAQGDIPYFDGNSLARLAPGTSGRLLQTDGPGANPQWAIPVIAAFPGTEVYNSSLGNTFVDLDLSSVVGVKKAFVVLKIKNIAAGVSGYFLRPNGETDFSATVYVGGLTTSEGAVVAQNISVLLACITDASGVIEWKRGAAGDTQAWVVMYVKLGS